jgi:hypothetical protein
MTERGQRIRDAFRAKYGVDHPSQLPSVKEKIKQKRKDGAYDGIIEKMKQTNLKKYGVEFYGNVEQGRRTKLKNMAMPTSITEKRWFKLISIDMVQKCHRKQLPPHHEDQNQERSDLRAKPTKIT